MDSLLNTAFIEYINTVYRPFESPCSSVGSIKTEIISDTRFDIQDKKPTIKQSLGTGSATYSNPESKSIKFIDYEDFLNHLPDNNIKDMRRCDFITYDLEGKSVFIVNELSLSSSAKNKINDARQQLHNAIFHFDKVKKIKDFISTYNQKLCIFSNKTKTIDTPEDIAKAFDKIREYLPEPIEHKFQPITKLGFNLIETALINV